MILIQSLRTLSVKVVFFCFVSRKPATWTCISNAWSMCPACAGWTTRSAGGVFSSRSRSAGTSYTLQVSFNHRLWIAPPHEAAQSQSDICRRLPDVTMRKQEEISSLFMFGTLSRWKELRCVFLNYSFNSLFCFCAKTGGKRFKFGCKQTFSI